MVLTPPFEPMLAQAAEYIPGSGVLASGFAAEQKFDGTARSSSPAPAAGCFCRPGAAPWSRTGRGRRAAAGRPGPRWRARRLGHLSRPAVLRSPPAPGRRPRPHRHRARAKTPAFFIAFDALQIDGIELLALPYAERRRRLEVLFAARALTAPWTLCPMTTDPDKAREWLEDWTDVSGVEGLVVKALNQRYRPGARDRAWTKIRRRNTTKAIIGAITGTLACPQLLVLGRHDATGRLRHIGRTVPLHPDAARELAEHLTPAGVGHPWTGAKFSSAWGTRDVLDTTRLNRPRVAPAHASRSAPRNPLPRYVEGTSLAASMLGLSER
ncbi:ATP-dependent DNA ligase [Streptomyces virginiae]|uniref:ATP-dependent DNA ligase n=1 Tax=Streptomyces virginiae TaxID=1961 RepID=UPI00366840F6